MRKTILLFPLLFVALLPASAEEIVLKDGTKVIGRMVGIKNDKIEVQTPYGKMQIQRSDILAINFPENEGTAVSSTSAGKPRSVDESLTGTQYINHTGNFTLTVPIEWKMNPELRASADALAGLSSRDDMRFVVVQHEPFTGSLESYKGLVEVQTRRNLTDYEKLSEANVTIDGHPAVLLTIRGTNAEAHNLPVEFLVVIGSFGGEYVHGVAWCIEPLFNESQRTLESILLSYKRISDPSKGASETAFPTSTSRREPGATRMAVDGQAQLTRIIERVEPAYPPLARQTRVQGTVRLHAIIGIDGRVEELEAIAGHPLLIQSAMDAVRKWRYSPTTLNGQPVEVETTIDVVFSLEEDRPHSALWRKTGPAASRRKANQPIYDAAASSSCACDRSLCS
jgi:protein TonB